MHAHAWRRASLPKKMHVIAVGNALCLAGKSMN